MSAKDRATGKSQAITITASSGLGDDEIERMVKEAQAHAEGDKEKKEEIEAHNRADGLIYSTEKTLRENREKVPASEASEVEKAIEEARKALAEGPKEDIERAAEALTAASHKLAEILYKSAAEAPPPAAGEAEAKGEEPEVGDVIDAEVVDEDKSKE